MLFNSKELWAERNKLVESQRALMDEDKVDEARVVEGQIKQIDLTLEHVLGEEQKMRDTSRIAKTPSASFAEQILGARDEFRGLEVGFRVEGDPTVTTVTAPTQVELEIPGKRPALLNNFAATLGSAEASGDIEFRQRSAQYGEPDAWAGVKDGSSATKSKVVYTWKPAKALKETIAGYVPVSKATLKDYAELANIIESDLILDVNEKENGKFLTGSNSTGIIGVLNTPGILAFTVGVGGLYYEAIRLMRTKVMKEARRVPTHVCLHPDIKTAIDLYKTETGLYQFLGDNTLWGMTVVEDFDCAGILVYDATCARKRPVHTMSVEVGYVNDQFIKNELCVLAEKTTALQTTYPDGFCYASKTDLDKTAA
ncbi:phage major capsid protein [Adlercreutzia shanghongiae]|uniref:Phage major capsid protein n=1 Tax=Adlercreutzia shanghongiae TaxID=3111773 RepID=A0ABU6IW62_9ACTN|nr:phage major capsid protein [Adlercreutzia sp. R22]MEC4294040.1 phage major capsid protein [Adlercreutzia sp. R22]